ncbi:superoxide dismutase family protein [Aureibaculum sp. 2210JD6-5]|uniref:superoxide dismutase family protein n=1 Tax=Aureibaculum sp. 2210JD6-5 TaxID=3103957 RepID=UPI002AAD4D26|nr:superoxide dismutase family protein [Aureibaculum sp. 2210JD6-5]MDY7395268.1 superoxide dismutase family protein [Aureibaculum sp. 2210JD6-5]
MKTKIITIMVLVFFTAISCKNDKKTDKADDTIDSVTETARTMPDAIVEKDETIKVELMAKSNSNVTGEIIFIQKDNMVTMTASLQGLTPGEHAIHLHETADCSSDDATSTGGHWNPEDKQHSKWGDENGYHRGDIGNLTADADGNATMTFETDQWAIGGDDENKNIIGRGIIVHEKADDFTTQPTGAAGARVACGEIK